MSISAPIVITTDQRLELESLVRQSLAPASLVLRCRIVLLAAEGVGNRKIGRSLGCHYNNVGKWITRWRSSPGLAGLRDEPRSGRPGSLTPSAIQRVVTRVCRKPPSHLSRWSVRTLAADLGMAATPVARILNEHDLHPHRLRTFTFSPDPQFEEKLLDAVGLYMNPPENAVVLCVDEKTGIQALDRTQPLIPLRAKKPRAWTNEYVRHGTRTMLAALNVATGSVQAHIKKRRTSKDFLGFMNDVVKAHRRQRLCVIMDNLNTHTNKAAQDWLARHPLVTFHYTPTHASWINLIECFFSILTRQGLQQAVHTSARELTKFLKRYVEEYNRSCGPFVWTKGPEKLKKIIQLTKRFQRDSHSN
jgi:transposase